MESRLDSREERQPYDPLPFTLSRAGTYPDIEDAIEGVLTVGGHEWCREALVKIVAGMLPFTTEESTKDDAQEYIGTLNKIRDEVISLVSGWDFGKVGPDELVAWSTASRRRLWYLDPMPFTTYTHVPLLPEAALSDNRLLVAMGFLLGSRQPYQDWVRLWTEIEFGKGCSREIDKRVQKRTVGGLYISLVYGSVAAREIAHSQLLEKAIWGARSIRLHPDEQQDWEDKIGDADWVIARDAKKAEGMFSGEGRRILRDILKGDFEYIGKKLKNVLVDNLRKAEAKKRIPQERLDSLEGIFEETGFEPGRWDEVLKKNEVKARIDLYRQEIIDACGPRASDVMKALIDEPTLTNQAVAERVGISERQVYNVRNRLLENPGLIRRVCLGD